MLSSITFSHLFLKSKSFFFLPKKEKGHNPRTNGSSPKLNKFSFIKNTLCYTCLSHFKPGSKNSVMEEGIQTAHQALGTNASAVRAAVYFATRPSRIPRPAGSGGSPPYSVPGPQGAANGLVGRRMCVLCRVRLAWQWWGFFFWQCQALRPQLELLSVWLVLRGPGYSDPAGLNKTLIRLARGDAKLSQDRRHHPI